LTDFRASSVVVTCWGIHLLGSEIVPPTLPWQSFEDFRFTHYVRETQLKKKYFHISF